MRPWKLGMVLLISCLFCQMCWSTEVDIFKPFLQLERIEQPKFTAKKLLPTQRLKLSEITLKGIIWKSHGRALALIEDSTGKGYIIKVGEPLGPGYVKKIMKDRIVVEEKYVDIFGHYKTKSIEIILPKKEEAVSP